MKHGFGRQKSFTDPCFIRGRNVFWLQFLRAIINSGSPPFVLIIVANQPAGASPGLFSLNAAKPQPNRSSDAYVRTDD